MDLKTNFPQGPIKIVKGRCITLVGNDIDTDRIIPARFLKCVSFESLGDNVFADDRIQLKGKHPFDKKENKGAAILVVNDNFGCGSSREHAPQALMRWGIKAIIGQSFAEIFYGNCLALGIPCATVANKELVQMQKVIKNYPELHWDLNLQQQSLNSSNYEWHLEFESGGLEMLLTGKWDATSQLISQGEKIDKRIKLIPYLNNFT